VKIEGIIWLEDIIEKLWLKHEVKTFEAEELFENKPHFRFVEKGHYEGENVYAAMGQTDSGRYLTTFFVYKQNNEALIISSRTMTSAERKLYGKH